MLTGILYRNMPKEIRKCCYKDVFLKRKSIICPVVLKGKKEADKGILRQNSMQ